MEDGLELADRPMILLRFTLPSNEHWKERLSLSRGNCSLCLVRVQLVAPSFCCCPDLVWEGVT